MAPEQENTEENEPQADEESGRAGDEKNAQSWISLLQQIGQSVVPALVTAGGLVGFAAFAGSVIVWTRFSAAQVPPDQVVAAYPRGELVAIASALLLLFGFVGLIAVVVAYLINTKGKATVGMFRGLLGLLAVEGMVAIFLFPSSAEVRVIAAELFLLPTAVAFWATFIYERPDLLRPDSQAQVKRGKDAPSTGKKGPSGWTDDMLEELDTLFPWEFARFVLITFAAACVAFLVARALGASPTDTLIGALAFVGLLPTLFLILRWIVDETPGEKVTVERGEVPFTRPGQVLILALLIVAAIGPWLILGSGWVSVLLLAAAALVAGLWRIAVLSNGKFMWYGVAVFVSVLLFGTITLMVRNIADPQVQPMALIRKDDGPAESIQGLYVTETDDRVYLATVSTEGCSDNLAPHSGRLLWVPKAEVVAMSVGPPQSIDDAAKTALEMSYSLTPAVETPAGDHVSLTVAEKRGTGKPQPGTTADERRLENAGPAVRPNFGAGLRLDPERVSPGDLATLRMSSPNSNDSVDGFGRYREGRTLRLGGIPVDIAKEEAQSPWDAEYVETGQGQALKLVKHSVYRRIDKRYVAVERGYAGESGLYVRLDDGAVEEVRADGRATDHYLPLVPGRTDRLLRNSPELSLRDGLKTALKPHLLRQAWHEDRIQFRVPENALTGAVTVECEQLAGQPLLRVSEPPEPRIAIHIDPGSERVVFDSGGSDDPNGEIVSRRWSVGGLASGGEVEIERRLPMRLESYSVRLLVTDRSGESASTEVNLLRLREDLVAPDGPRSARRAALRRAKAAMQTVMARESAAAVEFEARPSGVHPASRDGHLTLGEVERAQQALMRVDPEQSATTSSEAEGLALRARAYGSECPAREAGREGRLDVLVMGEGVRVVSSAGCAPASSKTTRSLLTPR